MFNHIDASISTLTFVLGFVLGFTVKPTPEVRRIGERTSVLKTPRETTIEAPKPGVTPKKRPVVSSLSQADAQPNDPVILDVDRFVALAMEDAREYSREPYGFDELGTFKTCLTKVLFDVLWTHLDGDEFLWWSLGATLPKFILLTKSELRIVEDRTSYAFIQLM
jgi:hypothetical protein